MGGVRNRDQFSNFTPSRGTVLNEVLMEWLRLKVHFLIII
jgi:hypothetical protein